MNLIKKDCGIAPLDARLLLQHVLGVSHEELIKIESVNENQERQFLELVERRKVGEPVAKIVGQKDFWKHSFKTTKDTLDPRPDSETLIEAVLKTCPDSNYRILDLGIGTGCLLLSLLDEYENATGVGVDISDSALEVAKENAKDLGLEDRAEFIKSNWTENVEGKFDIIISNPPYIPTKDIDGLEKEVKDFDPKSALDGGESGVDCYEEIISQIKELLGENGKVFFEIGQGQEEDLKNIAAENGFVVGEEFKDLSGVVRTCLVCF